MSLAKRVERLESAAGLNREAAPDMVIRFVDAVRGADGLMRPGPCTGGVLMSVGKPPQWLDADMNPIPGPVA